jgi:hypothetical protein
MLLVAEGFFGTIELLESELDPVDPLFELLPQPARATTSPRASIPCLIRTSAP